MNDLLVLLGKRIHELRAAKKWSQEEFAHVSELHRTYIGQIERGEKNISFDNLSRVAGTLGVNLSALLEGLEEGSAGKLAESHLAESQAQAKLAEQHAKDADAKAEGFRLEIAKANESAAKAEERAASLNLELARLKAPRTLNGSQARVISAAISTFTGQEFELGTIMGGGEPTAFAKRLAEVLALEGWKPAKNQGFRNIFGSNGITVILNPKAEDRTRAAAAVLAKALESCGFIGVTAIDETTPPNIVRIEIRLATFR